MVVLGVYPLLWSSGMFYQVAFAAGRIGAFNVCSAVLSIAVAAGLWLFVVKLGMGAKGAAYGVGGALALVHILMIWPLGLRFIGGSWAIFTRQSLIPGLGPALAATAAGWLFLELAAPTTWSMLGLGTLIVWAVYFPLIFAVADAGDRARIRRIWTHLGARSRRDR
jgi:hypothetical protein